MSQFSQTLQDTYPKMIDIISFKTLAASKNIEFFLLLKEFMLKILRCVRKVCK